MRQIASTTNAMPATTLLQRPSVPEKPKAHGEAITQTPSTSSAHEKSFILFVQLRQNGRLELGERKRARDELVADEERRRPVDSVRDRLRVLGLDGGLVLPRIHAGSELPFLYS